MKITEEKRKLYLLLCRLGLEGFGGAYRERVQRILAEFEDQESESESLTADGDSEHGENPDVGRSRANSTTSRDSLAREMQKRKWSGDDY